MEPMNVSVEAACRALSLGKTTFYQLLGKGEFRTIKIGRRTLVPVSEIHAFNSRHLGDLPIAREGR